VRASQNGVVAYAGNELRGYGNLVLIRHDGGWMTAYAHNDSLLVGKGDVVRRGQVISHSGRSGGVSRPQAHFEIRRDGEPNRIRAVCIGDYLALWVNGHFLMEARASRRGRGAVGLAGVRNYGGRRLSVQFDELEVWAAARDS